MKNPIKFSPNTRIILYAIISLTLAIICYASLINPSINKLRALNQQIKPLQMQQDNNQKLINLQLKLHSTKPMSTNVISTIYQLANCNNIPIEKITRQQQQIKLELQTNYQRLVMFLTQLNNAPINIKFQNITISKRHAQITLNIIKEKT